MRSEAIQTVGSNSAHGELEGDEAGLIEAKSQAGGNGKVVGGVGGGFAGGHFSLSYGAAGSEVALGIAALADAEEPEHHELNE